MSKTEHAKYKISLVDKMSLGLDKLFSKSSRLDRSLNKTNQTAKKSGGIFSNMGVGAAAGLAGLAVGVYQAGKAFLSAGSEMEQSRIAFQTLIGTIEGGNKTMSELEEFANVTPFSTKGVQKAGRTLLGFGVEAKALMPTLKVLGDISAGTGKDLSELGVIYGQIKGAGRLMGQDLLQLINAGFNPLQAISERTGESMGKLKDRMSKGLIPFAEVQQAFIDVTSEGGRFNNLMEKQSQTAGGLWSTLLGKIQAGIAGTSEGFMSVVKPLLNGAIEIVDFFSNSWGDIAEVFAPLTGLIRETWSEFSKLFGGMGEGLTITGFLKKAFNGLGAVIRFLMPALRNLAKTTLFIFGAIKSVSTAIVDWVKRTEWAGTALKGFVSGVIAGFVTIRTYAMSILSGVGDLLSGIFTMDTDQIKKGLKGLVTSAAVAGKDGMKAFNESMSTEAGDFFGKSEGKKEKTVYKGLQEFVDPTASNGGAGGGAAGKSASTSVDKVSGGRPTHIFVDIEKLVENFNINYSSESQTAEDIKEMVSRALVSAVNDVNLIAK